MNQIVPNTPHPPPNPSAAMAWHAQSVAETLAALKLNEGVLEQGLSAEEAQKRLQQYGHNRLAAARPRSAFKRLLLQFHNILLYVMMASALVMAFLGHWVDTGVLLAAVLVNVFIGFIQEGKAEAALNAIRNMLSHQAVVLRDGSRHTVDAADLVPGDVVLLTAGDRVPADVRLLDVNGLRVEEAALTGESLPVDKQAAAVAAEAALGDRLSMAYSGTLAVYGQAKALVVATGAATELGHINTMLADVEAATTPLLRQMNAFAHKLALFILAFAAAAFVLGTQLAGMAAADMFLMVVALVASAIPEGLPAIMTVTLALGVQRMARRKAIVRRLPAVEALGSVTVICSDKTGTLTRNEMMIEHVVCADVRYRIEGSGYDPEGRILRNGAAVNPTEERALAQAVRAGVLCNDAHMRKLPETDGGGSWQLEGDPTEGALLVLGSKTQLLSDQAFAQDQLAAAWPRADSIPFESEHCYMATLHRRDGHADVLYLKGAPEVIIGFCDTQWNEAGVQPLDADYWRRAASDLAAQGLRVLALAQKLPENGQTRLLAEGERLNHEHAQSGATLLALVGLTDPPRSEAISAVRQCHEAGIRVKMITGDHAETARAIGAQLGISTRGGQTAALTGNELARMDDQALRRAAAETDVFARASPEQKLRLVRALQAEGEVVAMTGDGVNDAPALKCADVGVAMGLKGTEAAKEAGDIVLADDNFATIASAVEEGRAVYDNLRKFILFMLPTNGGESLIIVCALILQVALPLTPAQVLWINMVTSSALGLALAFERAEPKIMTRPPRPPGRPLLDGLAVWRICLVAVVMMAGALGLFLWALSQGWSLEVARTMAVNTVVWAEMVYLINSRHILGSVISREGLLGNPYVLLSIAACVPLQLIFTYWPLMQDLMGSAALDWRQWLAVLAAGGSVFFIVESDKWIQRRMRRRKNLAR